MPKGILLQNGKKIKWQVNIWTHVTKQDQHKGPLCTGVVTKLNFSSIHQ